MNGILGGQIHFPPTLPANPANPFLLCTLTWEPGHFRPGHVPVGTATSRFDVYISPTSPASQGRLSGLVEGSGVIHVFPAPAGAGPLLAIAVLAPRRRGRAAP